MPSRLSATQDEVSVLMKLFLALAIESVHPAPSSMIIAKLGSSSVGTWGPKTPVSKRKPSNHLELETLQPRAACAPAFLTMATLNHSHTGSIPSKSVGPWALKKPLQKNPSIKADVWKPLHPCVSKTVSNSNLCSPQQTVKVRLMGPGSGTSGWLRMRRFPNPCTHETLIFVLALELSRFMLNPEGKIY